jgi:excisionase family DNA binding protein
LTVVSDIDHPDPLSRGSNAPGGPPTPGAVSLLDVRCVANRLGLSTKAIRGLIARGELPAYKVAGRIRIDPADVDGYLATARIRADVRLRRHRHEAAATHGTPGGLRAVFRSSDAAA